jgi:hypothetical protein
VPGFLRDTLRIRRQLAHTPRLVGYGLNAQPARKTLWTFLLRDDQVGGKSDNPADEGGKKAKFGDGKRSRRRIDRLYGSSRPHFRRRVCSRMYDRDAAQSGFPGGQQSRALGSIQRSSEVPDIESLGARS